jgi:hypothetical protein
MLSATTIFGGDTVATQSDATRCNTTQRDGAPTSEGVKSLSVARPLRPCFRVPQVSSGETLFASAPNSPWTHTPPMSRTMYYPHPGPATPPCEDSTWPWFIPEAENPANAWEDQAEERPSHSQTYPTSDTRTDLHVTDSWPSGSLLRTRRGVAVPPLVSLPLCKADGGSPSRDPY